MQAILVDRSGPVSVTAEPGTSADAGLSKAETPPAIAPIKVGTPSRSNSRPSTPKGPGKSCLTYCTCDLKLRPSRIDHATYTEPCSPNMRGLGDNYFAVLPATRMPPSAPMLCCRGRSQSSMLLHPGQGGSISPKGYLVSPGGAAKAPFWDAPSEAAEGGADPHRVPRPDRRLRRGNGRLARSA